MERIKFKIWNEETGVMLKWLDAKTPEEELIEEFERNVDMMGLGFDRYSHRKYLLYSGVTDKQGKEYCDGDIVRVNKFGFDSAAPLPENLVVRFYGGMFQLFRGKECLMGLNLNYIDDGEIIGTEYENPELMTVSFREREGE